MLIFDILAIFGAYWLYSNVNGVHEQVERASNTIVFESSLSFIVLLLIMPVLHLLSVSNLERSVLLIIHRFQLPIFIGSVILLISFKFYLNYHITSYLKTNNYILCSDFNKGRYHSETYQKNSCNSELAELPNKH